MITDSLPFKVKKGAHYVYAVQGVQSQLIKIGVSCHPLVRLHTIQKERREPMALLYALEFDDKTQAYLVEGHLHALFARHRGRSKEWFKITPTVIGNVIELAYLIGGARKVHDAVSHTLEMPSAQSATLRAHASNKKPVYDFSELEEKTDWGDNDV